MTNKLSAAYDTFPTPPHMLAGSCGGFQHRHCDNDVQIIVALQQKLH
jgi:hypothetical protein